jgi:catechol 2,3-dioxygenase-like lactoylglutathione lyase family enzyme
MRIGHIELPVSDPLSSARFYIDALGFESVVDDERVSWLALDGLELQLRRGSPQSTKEDRNAVNLVLYSHDVGTDLGRLNAAGVATEERANCHHFQDPDGHWWQLVDPRADHSGA